MKKIIFIVPYFGTMRADFKFWLHSCSLNSEINWLIFTDDNSVFNIPEISSNIKIKYMEFKDMQNKIQSCYDFTVYIDKPYKLCDFKPAYGEIFENELEGYDFWGHCDMDMIFGNIREYITDSILDENERIGKWGHAVLYKNTEENNRVYRTIFDDVDNYRKVFQCSESCYFDERGVLEIYQRLQINCYNNLHIADINPAWWNFRIPYTDDKGKEKNKYLIFSWEDGRVFAYSIYQNSICKEEFMYVHFQKRPMRLIGVDQKVKQLLIVPNTISNITEILITQSMIRKNSKNKVVNYWCAFIKIKWKVITIKKITSYIKYRVEILKQS